jgi:TonB-dependent SusC/RagA subfamily outer membrane receptor|tara:strand:- start:305 stop:682 length:378 start_codon:yes stop_codon:yes gene_type:complete
MKNYFLLSLLLSLVIASCSSTTTITREDNNKDNNQNMENVSLIDQLKRYPGLSIRGTQVFMRGISSINNPNEVLFIVNGTQVGNFSGVSTISPQEVKRIEVIKNPADLAIYGLRGSGGVVLITTY